MSDYTPEQDELFTVIETAHRGAWTDATEYADAPHSIRAAVVRWLAEHDRQERADERARVLTIIRARFEDLARLERSGRVFDDSVRFVLSHIADVPE